MLFKKMKAKIDKDKAVIMAEIADARAATEEVVRAQASQDKSNKALLDQLNATTWLEQSKMEIVLHFLGPGHLLDNLRAVWLEWGQAADVVSLMCSLNLPFAEIRSKQIW